MSRGLGCGEKNQPGVVTNVKQFVGYIRDVVELFGEFPINLTPGQRRVFIFFCYLAVTFSGALAAGFWIIICLQKLTSEAQSNKLLVTKQ